MPPSIYAPADDFFAWLGKCITAWARVEDHLFEICVHSLGATKQRTAIVYYRTPTLDGRLNLTDELVRTVLPIREKKRGGHDHEDVLAWKKVRNEITSLLPTRNRLAHHPVLEKQAIQVSVPYAVPISSAASDLLGGFSWYESYVSDAERLRGRHEDVKPLTAPDLSSHRVDVEMLITTLEIFRIHVLAKYPNA